MLTQLLLLLLLLLLLPQVEECIPPDHDRHLQLQLQYLARQSRATHKGARGSLGTIYFLQLMLLCVLLLLLPLLPPNIWKNVSTRLQQGFLSCS
jgi:hypothetical protein